MSAPVDMTNNVTQESMEAKAKDVYRSMLAEISIVGGADQRSADDMFSMVLDGYKKLLDDIVRLKDEHSTALKAEATKYEGEVDRLTSQCVDGGKAKEVAELALQLEEEKKKATHLANQLAAETTKAAHLETQLAARPALIVIFTQPGHYVSTRAIHQPMPLTALLENYAMEHGQEDGKYIVVRNNKRPNLVVSPRKITVSPAEYALRGLSIDCSDADDAVSGGECGYVSYELTYVMVSPTLKRAPTDTPGTETSKKRIL